MSLAQVTTRQYPLHKWASRSQACPFRDHPPETPGDSQHSFSQCSSASYAPYPHRVEPPSKQSALGNEFLGPFCRCAHGVTGRGRVSENGAGGQASGETIGFGGAFLGTDRATVGSAPPLTTSGCSLLSPLIWIGGSTLDIPVFSPVMATWRISANSGGVPWEGPPTSSIAPTTLSHRQV